MKVFNKPAPGCYHKEQTVIVTGINMEKEETDYVLVNYYDYHNFKYIQLNNPSRRYIVKKETISDILKREGYNIENSSQRLDYIMENYPLNPDVQVISKIPDVIVKTKLINIPEGFSEKVLKQCHKPHRVFLGIKEIEELDGKICIKYKEVCSECGSELIEGNLCPTCNEKINNVITSKTQRELMKLFPSKYYDYYVTASSENYYIGKHPENDFGIVIYKIKYEIEQKDNVITTTLKLESSLEHIIGEKATCIKHNLRNTREIDVMKFFNINSNTICCVNNLIFEESMYDFMKNNTGYLTRSGLLSTMSLFKDNAHIEPFIMTFICLMVKYPVLEQLMKAGHYNLFFSLYSSLLKSDNKAEISRRIEGLNELIDMDATSSKKALRFPSYIGDYLSKKNSEISEYYFWRDVYELTNISKEKFELFVQSPEYCLVNLALGTYSYVISCILKYGYSIEKLYSYILKLQKEKEQDSEHFSIGLTTSLLKDYLQTCEILEVEPDKFPKNLVDVHDRAAAALRVAKDKINDENILSIANQCKEYIDSSKIENKKISELMDELLIVFPESTSDFIEEGNKQHNCVGGYYNSVLRGTNVIFFIRKKSEPEKSYITAEITINGLGQCLLSNNRQVQNKDHVHFARNIANKVCRGCQSGKIKALSNIKALSTSNI